LIRAASDAANAAKYGALSTLWHDDRLENLRVFLEACWQEEGVMSTSKKPLKR
jgi:hypothetical protein